MIRYTIENRLEDYAKEGIDSGIKLFIWKRKAKSLERDGIILKYLHPSQRKGEALYDISFSDPIPNTLSERLYNIAKDARKEATVN